MTARKRTEITVETERVVVIRRTASRRMWCAQCGCEVDMVDLEEAAKIAGTDHPMFSDARLGSQVLRGEAQALWHVFELQQGERLVCLESLLRSM